MIRKTLAFPALLAIAAIPLVAQADDPPSRVARVNLLSGSVSFRPGSVDEWTAATLNYPLTTGDHLWVDADGRAEIHAGSTAIRMAPRTALSILNLDDRAVQLSLTDGSLHVRIRQLADDETFEVDTPNVAITFLRAGEYRVDADGDNNTTSVTVRSGNAEVTGGGTAFTVHPRETGRATGIDAVTQEIGPALPTGEFDAWCEARDRREDQENISAQYVPRDMVGYEDLDQNGVWSEVPEYGPVWRPRTVPVGWAPYRYGHWAWVEPWGWTWIDDAPWGFAPFHYGRWAMVGGGWGWIPGHMVVGVRPVYAPALVVFVGTSRVGVAAWFPLGPREVYRPAYHVSDYYVRQVNITHVTNVTVVNNVYVNQRIPGGVTVVSRETFVNARPIGRSAVAIDQREIMQARVIGTAAPIAPMRVSVLARGGPAVAPPPARFVDRAVVARRTPPPPPVSFEARRTALEANQGRPLDPGQVERYRSGPARNPMVRIAPGAASNPPQRPVNIPRDERGPLRRPASQPEPQQVQPPPARVAPVDRPRFEPPMQQQPAPAPRVQPPADRPRFEPPMQQQPAPAPRVQPPADRPRFDRPQQRVETPPADSPRRNDTPRVERPQPVTPPPAAPRVERPAPEERRDARPAPRGDQNDERKTVRRGEKKEEKKDDKK